MKSCRASITASVRCTAVDSRPPAFARQRLLRPHGAPDKKLIVQQRHFLLAIFALSRRSPCTRRLAVDFEQPIGEVAVLGVSWLHQCQLDRLTQKLRPALLADRVKCAYTAASSLVTIYLQTSPDREPVANVSACFGTPKAPPGTSPKKCPYAVQAPAGLSACTDQRVGQQQGQQIELPFPLPHNSFNRALACDFRSFRCWKKFISRQALSNESPMTYT